ncbi:hypothetical protein [uncultured Microscilla sp.]|uniref:hypothetical protein n=1 Tax=uncultured Microscilla sp. TaxID=432653 RepID=UPI0026231404|nr:hypothetical protein [uncultured Microscilla sp.]
MLRLKKYVWILCMLGGLSVAQAQSTEILLINKKWVVSFDATIAKLSEAELKEMQLFSKESRTRTKKMMENAYIIFEAGGKGEVFKKGKIKKITWKLSDDKVLSVISEFGSENTAKLLEITKKRMVLRETNKGNKTLDIVLAAKK